MPLAMEDQVLVLEDVSVLDQSPIEGEEKEEHKNESSTLVDSSKLSSGKVAGKSTENLLSRTKIYRNPFDDENDGENLSLVYEEKPVEKFTIDSSGKVSLLDSRKKVKEKKPEGLVENFLSEPALKSKISDYAPVKVKLSNYLFDFYFFIETFSKKKSEKAI